MADSGIPIDELETHCFEIINELSEHRFATFESVVSVLLERYDVVDFNELHSDGVCGVPLLQRLRRLNVYVNTFLDMFLFDQTVLSLKECEDQLCDMLRNLSIQPSYIKHFVKEERKGDPNEVQLEHNEMLEIPASSIHDYLCGKIQNHPKILRTFPQPLLQHYDGNMSGTLKVAQVYAHRRDFLSSASHGKSFESYLLEKYNVDSIFKLGIVLPQSFHRESLIQRNVTQMSAAPSSVSTIVQIANARQSSFEPENVFRYPIEAHLSSSVETDKISQTIQNNFLKGLCFPLNFPENEKEKDFLELKNIGKWGEALVYQYLLQKYEGQKITWMNEKEESMSCYDLVVEFEMSENNKDKKRKTMQTIFIEVKSTRFPNLNVFDISQNEWEFCSKLPAIRYDIYRVYNAGNPDYVHIQVLQDVHSLINEKRLRLCLAV